MARDDGTAREMRRLRREMRQGRLENRGYNSGRHMDGDDDDVMETLAVWGFGALLAIGALGFALNWIDSKLGTNMMGWFHSLFGGLMDSAPATPSPTPTATP